MTVTIAPAGHLTPHRPRLSWCPEQDGAFRTAIGDGISPAAPPRVCLGLPLVAAGSPRTAGERGVTFEPHGGLRGSQETLGPRFRKPV